MDKIWTGIFHKNSAQHITELSAHLQTAIVCDVLTLGSDPIDEVPRPVDVQREIIVHV